MKNNNVKRAAALLLGVLLAVQTVSMALPVSALEEVLAAESAETKSAVSEGLAYEISDGAVTITDYSGEATELTIPSEIEGYPVTCIGNYAFSCCDSLMSVTIPEGVNRIGYMAFSYCSSLTVINVDSENTSYCSVDGVLFSKGQAELICCPGGEEVGSMRSLRA